jgi:hypothetical protein
MIKRLQEELGEEAEFDSDTSAVFDASMSSASEDYEERIRQLESEQREDDDEQAKDVERMRRECNMAQDEAAEAQREKITLFNEQKRCESQI